MSQATMTFQTKVQHSPRYNWRSVLITLFIFALLGGGGWWADQAGWLDRFVGQNTAVVTTTNNQAPANQAQQTTSATVSNAQAPTVQSTQANVTAKTMPTSKVSNKAATTPAVALVTLPVVAGVHGAQLWDQTGKQVTTLDIGALLTAKGRSADGAWLAVETNAGAGWVQTSQVVAYDVQSLAVTTLPAAVTAAVQQAQTTTLATTTATTAVVSPAVTTPVAVHWVATVSTTDGRLNVRSGPGTAYTILTKVNTGDELVVRGRNATGDWLQVQVADATADTGWVAAQYVTFSGDMNALPVSTI